MQVGADDVDLSTLDLHKTSKVYLAKMTANCLAHIIPRLPYVCAAVLHVERKYIFQFRQHNMAVLCARCHTWLTTSRSVRNSSSRSVAFTQSRNHIYITTKPSATSLCEQHNTRSPSALYRSLEQSLGLVF